MPLIDSHVHFDDFHADGTLQSIMDRAIEAGVTRMVAVGGTAAANVLSLELADRYPGVVIPSAGYDRDQAHLDPDMQSLSRLLPSVTAVGEIGLDYHYHPETADAQKTLLVKQLSMARSCHLPVIVHSREADADTLALLSEHAEQWDDAPGSIGVLHCFTGSRAFALELVKKGFMIGFSGIVTFKNAESVREAAEAVPEDRLLIETDTPYLAPVPYRGRRNEPAFVHHVAEKLAEIRGCTVDQITDITARNATRLFRCDE